MTKEMQCSEAEFETVIGLEIHAELMTERKLFCSCKNEFSLLPNIHTCPTCLGKGGKPIFHQDAATLAVRAGLLLGCEIMQKSAFDRKHYTYPDLPKGYQITQFFHPICLGGGLVVNGKRFGITRIHIEEDAGKLIHENGETRVDYNRCGVPLIEIVTEPDFRSASEVADFCRLLRRVLLFGGVCDGKMNEGSLRCDVNISLHKKGEPFGTRTEIKNLNSFKFIEKAILAEEKRQAQILRSGGSIARQTMHFDEKTETTHPMRDKEESVDYGYCPDKDLEPLVLSQKELNKIRDQLPPTYLSFKERFETQYRLNEEAAHQLLSSPEIAQAFDACAKISPDPLLCARLYALCVKEQSVDPIHFAGLIELLIEEKITQNDARRLTMLLCQSDFDPKEKAKEMGMLLVFDKDLVISAIEQAIQASPSQYAEYLAGKTSLLGFFIGATKRNLTQNISPTKLSETVKNYLNQRMEESRNEPQDH